MAATVTRQDNLFYTHRLDNGVQLLGQLMPDVASAAAVFWVCTGTRDEPPDEMGVSHFLEHMVFRGSKNLSSEEIDRSFEEMGAEHNAATWLEMTFYWARVLSENVPWALEVLSDLLQPKLEKTSFDQERNVILEEIARYEDMPVHVLISKFMEDYFGQHPLSRETLGTPETIEALTVEQMREYWKQRYSTGNTLFAIAGNFDWDSIVNQLDTLTRGWQEGSPGRQLSPAPFASGFHPYQRDKFVQEQIAIGTPMVSRDDPRYFAAAVLATILGDDTGSRLFWALHETGLAETATTQVMEFEDNGVLLTHISTEPSQASTALQTAENELKRLQTFDLQPEELERAKAKLNSSIVISGESTSERVMALIRSWLTEGSLETLEEIRQKIEAVSLEDLRALVADRPVYPNQVITAVGPLSGDDLQPARG